MASKRKTVPYSTVDEKRDQPFTMELELASLFVIAEARRKRAHLSAMARVHYPLHIHRWEGGALLIDLLGLNYKSVNYRIIPDVEEFERALDGASENPEAFRVALRDKNTSFDKFVGQKTARINGLIVQPGKSEELNEFLEDIRAFEAKDEPVIFKPVLKSSDIRSIIASINSLRKDIKRDLKRLEQGRRSMRDTLDIVKKVLREEIQNIRDGSSKAKTRMKKELEKIKGRRRKALELDLKKIRKEYGRQATPLRGEHTKLRRRLARRSKKFDMLKRDKGNPAAAKRLSREIKEIEAKLKELDSTIKPLQAWRDAEVEKARVQYRSNIKSEEDKIKEEEAQSRDEIQRRKAEISELEAEVKGVAVRINKLIRSKKDRLSSLSRFCFDVEAETMDLYVPFYIFQYAKAFDFYPPVVASGGRGLLSRFKRMLAESMESKMNQLIRPRGDFFEKYLAKAVRGLRSEKGLASAYRRWGDGLNLLRSREAVDKIMMGLVRIRREGWISDGEYIRLQEALVDNLGLISRP